MRAGDRRALGGLLLLIVAVSIAAWLLGPGGETDSGGAADGGAAGAARDAAATKSLPASDAATVPQGLAPGAAAALPTLASDAPPPPGEPLTITGRVVDEQHHPVADALVLHWPTKAFRAATGLPDRPRWSGLDWKRLASTRSDADGRFTLSTRDEPADRAPLRGFSDGGFDTADPRGARPALLVEHEDFATTFALVEGAVGAADVGDIVLPAGAALAGRLVDSEGLPVAGVRVALLGSGGRGVRFDADDDLFELRTGQISADDGRFLLAGLPAHEFELHAEPRGFAPLSRKVSLARPETLDLGDIVLDRGGRITGRVVDAEDRPVAGAEVVARYPMRLDVIDGPDRPAVLWPMRVTSGERYVDQATVADQDGAFSLSGLRSEVPSWRVLARAEGFDPALEESAVPGLGELLLRLQPEAMWHLQLLDAASDATVAGAQVEALRFTQAGSEWYAPCDVMVVEDGWLVRGAGLVSTRVSVTAPGHAPQVEQLPGLHPGERSEHVVRLAAERVIEGRVIDDGQLPLAHAAVQLAQAEEENVETHWRELTTDAAGRFRFGQVGAGAWRLRARAADCLPMVRPLDVAVAADAVPVRVEIVLPRGGTIRGSVLEASGQPAASGLVTAKTEAADVIARSCAAGAASAGSPAAAQELPQSLQRTTLTSGDGVFILSGLAPGAWTVGADHGAPVAVTVVAHETVEVALRRSGTPHVRGRVTAAGRPVAGAKVELGDSDLARFYDHPDAATQTALDGSFDLELNWAGSVDLWVRGPTGPLRPKAVTLEWDRITYADIALPGGRVTGRVVQRGGGEAAAGVEVSLTESRGPPEPGRLAFELDTRSGADGRFAFECVDDGDWRLHAGGEFWIALADVDVHVAAGDELPARMLEVEAGGRVVVVLENQGAWLRTFATLTPLQGQSSRVQDHASPMGEITLGPVQPGDYEIGIAHKDGDALILDRSAHVTVVAGKTLTLKSTLDG